VWGKYISFYVNAGSTHNNHYALVSYFTLFRSDTVTLTDIVALTVCDKSVACRLHDAYFNFQVTILYHASVVIFES